MMETESHPFRPFLPENAQILMAGSFPPPQVRWCIDWYYPNYINDMWRIWGYLVSGDKNLFVIPERKTFNQPLIEAFCRNTGLALSDTGEVVKRLKNNASDKFLEIVKPRDFGSLLDRIKQCHSIVLTGEKAIETLGSVYGFSDVKVGEYVLTTIGDRDVKVWRMPSSSRAYPRSIEWKAAYYKRVIDDLGIKLQLPESL